MLHLVRGFVWSWNLDASGSRSEIPVKFWNVVLQKDGEDHVRNEEVLLRVNEQRNILHKIIKRKANWIGHILRRNCLLKQVIEGKVKGGMEVTRRRGRRRKNLLDDLKDRKGYSHLKEEALDALCWGIVLEEALDLSKGRIMNEWMNRHSQLIRSSNLIHGDIWTVPSWSRQQAVTINCITCTYAVYTVPDSRW